MVTPIPNACKTNQFEKCPHGIDVCKTCRNIGSCKHYIPIYSWREVSDYYTCRKCYDPCDFLGCPKCFPEEYKRNLAIIMDDK